MGHVFARISGHGWTLISFDPYRFAQVGPRRIRVSHGGREAVVDFSGAQPVVISGSVAEVADLEPGPARDGWVIETTVYTVAWPAGFEVAAPADAVSKFDLVGPAGELIYLQGPVAPARVPALESMVGAGPRIRKLDERDRVIELDYERDGAPWLQRHQVVPLSSLQSMIVTMQCPLAQAEGALRACAELALTVSRYLE